MDKVISLILSLPIILFCIYYTQIKEYRLDRIFSGLKDIRLGFYLPAKSLRNILIFALSLSFVYLFGFFAVLVSPILVLIFVVATSPLAQVKRKSLIKKAVAKLATSDTIVIGITGSFGKTSTKEYLHTILETKFKVAKTEANHNTEVGIAIDILKYLKSDTQVFIAEVGAYKIGEIKSVVAWLKPTYGMLTGIGDQHLELFGGMENLVSAKKELLDSLPESGTAYVNKDTEWLSQLTQDIKCKIKYFSKTDDFNYETSLLGNHARMNLFPCVMLAQDLGIEADIVASAVKSIKNRFGNLSAHFGINGTKLIYDGKNSNVDGFLSALDALTGFDGPKYVLSKGIIELGRNQMSAYKKIQDKAQVVGAQILTLDKKLGGKYFSSEAQLFKYLQQNVSEDDIILIEGRFSGKFVQSLGIKHAKTN